MKAFGFSLFLLFAVLTTWAVLPHQNNVVHHADFASVQSESVAHSAYDAGSESKTRTTYFGFEDLRNLISVKNITSIEELLANLPTDLLTSYTLVYESKSRMQGASLENPRAILFGSTAELMLTFNGSREQAGYQSVETLALDPVKKTYTLHEITFSESTKPVFSEANPAKCVVCHESNPRPVWNEYRTWGGVYGHDDDNLGHTHAEWLQLGLKEEQITDMYVMPERTGFDKFRSTARLHPRYRYLRMSDQLPCFPYHCAAGELDKSFRDSPNTRLTMLNILNNGIAKAHRISQSSNFEFYKYSLARSLGCGLNAKEQDAVFSRMSHAAQLPLGEAQPESRTAWIKAVSTPDNVINLFDIPYASTSLALRLDDPGDNFIRSTMSDGKLRDERGAYTLAGLEGGFGSEKSSRLFLANQILREIAVEDPILKQMLDDNAGWKRYFEESYKSYKPSGGDADPKLLYAAPLSFIQYFDATQAVLPRTAKKKICEHLITRSDMELKATPSPSLEKTAAATFEASKNSVAESLVQHRCVTCHDRPGLDAAPKIPFNDPRAFHDYVRQQKVIGIDTLARIRAQLTPDENGEVAMPLAGSKLKPAEVEALMHYLKKLSP